MKFAATASLCLFGVAVLGAVSGAAFLLITWLLPLPAGTPGWGWAAGVVARFLICLACGFGTSAMAVLAFGPKGGRPGKLLVWGLASGVAALLAAYTAWQVLQALAGQWHGWPTMDTGEMSQVERIPYVAIPLAWCATWAIDVARRSGMIPE